MQLAGGVSDMLLLVRSAELPRSGAALTGAALCARSSCKGLLTLAPAHTHNQLLSGGAWLGVRRCGLDLGQPGLRLAGGGPCGSLLVSRMTALCANAGPAWPFSCWSLSLQAIGSCQVELIHACNLLARVAE